MSVFNGGPYVRLAFILNTSPSLNKEIIIFLLQFPINLYELIENIMQKLSLLY